jgi:hypothetical protein
MPTQAPAILGMLETIAALASAGAKGEDIRRDLLSH